MPLVLVLFASCVVYLASILLLPRLFQRTLPHSVSYPRTSSNSSHIEVHRKQALIKYSTISSIGKPQDLTKLTQHPVMAHGNPFQYNEPLPRPSNEADMLYNMSNNLNVRNPYRKYPPLGVPCAEGTSTFQLNLRREKWWQMLQEYAWKDRVMMQKFQLEEERKERLKQEQMQGKEQQEQQEVVKDEHKKQRKDSLVVEEKDVASANTSAGIADGKGAAAEAIYDSSGEEEDSEDERARQPEQAKRGKAKKTGGVKDHKEKGHKHGHKARRVKPLGCMKTHARQGSVASCTSSRASTSHSEVDVKEVRQGG